MSKKRNIECQMVIIMNNLCRFGESKYEAKAKKRLELEKAIKACKTEEEKSRLRAEAPEGIFSFSTMKTYIKLNKTFCRWVKKNHPVRDIKYAREFTGEYLQYCINKGNSPSTIKTKAAALAKLYHTHSYELGIVLPNRKREDITRSRTVPDEKIERKNQDVVDFIKGTGLRLHEVRMLEGRDVYRNKKGQLIVKVRKGKGGKKRKVTVLPEFADKIERLARKVKPKELVFKKVRKNINAHFYRAWFTQAFYNKCARDLNSLSRKEKYYMRIDRKGDVYDREAMKKVSKQLGHNRIDVIAGHYLYTPKVA